MSFLEILNIIFWFSFSYFIGWWADRVSVKCSCGSSPHITDQDSSDSTSSSD